MMFWVCSGCVLDTRNTLKPCATKDSANVPDVTGICARVHANTRKHIARTHTFLFSTRVHKEHTEHREHPCATKDSGVLGIGNTALQTRNIENKGISMPEIVIKFVAEVQQTSETIQSWVRTSIPGRLYLMSDIVFSAFGVEPHSKDAERLAPVVGRLLVESGMKNKRMRGPSGNRHYWVKRA